MRPYRHRLPVLRSIPTCRHASLLLTPHGPTRGRPWSAPAAREQLRRIAAGAGVRRRFAPHQLRHAHAVEMAREGVPLCRHPTTTRAREPRDHVRLPARHRQRRDHRDSPCSPRTHDPRHGRTPNDALTDGRLRAHCPTTAATVPVVSARYTSQR
ncbi:MAG: site-specific integrase [Actinobacteria bacterium]|nr:site-specific integrase [Actinomycetota bacterium]